MSAFMVDHAHINALLTWAITNKIYLHRRNFGFVSIDQHNADDFGQILANENARSVSTRYQDEDSWQYAFEYQFKPFPVDLSPEQVINACRCLDYQSCETDDWILTDAKRIISAISDAAAGLLAGKDDTWEIHADFGTKKRKQIHP